MGVVFSIAFRHDRSRNWSDHLGPMHQAVLARHERCGIVLWCSTCMLIIGNVPKALRKRKTSCTIRYHTDLNGWVDVGTGVGSPNGKAGDQFMPKLGRIAALRNALNETDLSLVPFFPTTENIHNFKAAVWAAYTNRKAKKENASA